MHHDSCSKMHPHNCYMGHGLESSKYLLRAVVAWIIRAPVAYGGGHARVTRAGASGHCVVRFPRII